MKFSRNAESSERSVAAGALRSEDSASRLNGIVVMGNSNHTSCVGGADCSR
jgi:hypothetical protein